MAFDESKDKVLGGPWNIKGEDDTIVEVTVCQYNGGAIKVQIGPRLMEKKNGDTVRLKAGRLTTNEFDQLMMMYPKIQKAYSVKKKAVGGKK